MDLVPITRRSASADVFEQLAEGLIDGRLKAGETLPAERSLTETLQVNRQAVREALQRLAQAGLVRIHQGEPTRVLDFRRSAGLDLLPRLLFRDGVPDPAVIRSVMEMRATIGSDVTRLAAQRAAPDEIATVRELTEGMRQSQDLDETARMDLLAWDRLVDMSDNIAYRLAFNSLKATYEPLIGALTPLLEEELRAHGQREQMVGAIGRGLPEVACDIARTILDIGTRSIERSLGQVGEMLEEDGR